MATGDRIKIFPTFSFRVELSGKLSAEFSECSGLEMTVKFDEVREGGENGFVHKLPGRVEFGNVVLKRGFVCGSELLQWFTEDPKHRRRTVTIQLTDQRVHPPRAVAQWVFDGAYPVKWSGPSFKAGENAIAIESLELAHRGLITNQR
jgi:phage tail-like protein